MPEPTELTPERLAEIRADLDRRVPAVDIADRDIARELLGEVNRLRAGVAEYRSVGWAVQEVDPSGREWFERHEDDEASALAEVERLKAAVFRHPDSTYRAVEVFVRDSQPNPAEEREA